MKIIRTTIVSIIAAVVLTLAITAPLSPSSAMHITVGIPFGKCFIGSCP